MTATDNASTDFGANAWLVDEMYERYRDDPGSVGETWQEFFEDYKPGHILSPAIAASAPAPIDEPPAAVAPAPTPAPAPEPAPAPAAPAAADPGKLILGAGLAIANNMAKSLDVPTATSFRNVPAKLLEINRQVINGYRSRTGQGKVSFTHLIGYAVVRAIADDVPVMNNEFVSGADGRPRLVQREHVSLALAVDVDKGNGQRTLVTPIIRDADTLDFAGFLAAYEDLIRRVKANKLTVEDFQGATISLTNPGTIGTVQSVPRLMPGQGVIIGVGSIDYPAEFQGADERTLQRVRRQQGRHDHQHVRPPDHPGRRERHVAQGACTSGCSASTTSTTSVFKSLGVPYASVNWRTDSNPDTSEDAMLHKQMQVATLIRVHRVRGHLIADLDPLRWTEPQMPVELDPATYGLTIWDLDREFLTGGVGGVPKMKLGKLLGVLRDAYCRTIGIEYMHIQETAEQRWIQQKVEGASREITKDQKYRILERLNAAEAFEKFLATKYVGTKRFGLEGAESAIPILDQLLSMAADAGLDSSVIGMAHRGRLNVLANVIGKSYNQIFKEFEGYVDPTSVQGSGDVKYHLGATGKYESPAGARHPPGAGGQPEPPGDRRPGRARHGAGHPGPDRPARLVSRRCRS